MWALEQEASMKDRQGCSPHRCLHGRWTGNTHTHLGDRGQSLWKARRPFKEGLQIRSNREERVFIIVYLLL